jgi:hypothetical protein
LHKATAVAPRRRHRTSGDFLASSRYAKSIVFDSISLKARGADSSSQ